MLIHLGGQEFIDVQSCVAIVNLQTVDQATRIKVLESIPEYGHERADEPRSAILTTQGRWQTSTISPEVLVQRGRSAPYPGAIYLRLSPEKIPGSD